MDDKELLKRIECMVFEDVGSGDITSSFTPNRKVEAVIDSNSEGYVSGIHELKLLFRKHRIKATAHVKDGEKLKAGKRIFTLVGRSRDILPLERMALNLLSKMSSVTTATRRYADELKRIGAHAKVAATRKTSPGLMQLEKKAVFFGGGVTHRMGLYDMVLLKDNHLKVFNGDVLAALKAAKKAKTGKRIEVEVNTAEDAVIAAKNGADLIMFDNMKPHEIKQAVALLEIGGLRRKVLLEASGGVTLDNIGEYGKTGVDWISVGKITYSAPGLDFTLEFLKVY